MPIVKSTERQIVEEVSGGRLNVTEFCQMAKMSRPTLRNWANNPAKRPGLELMIRGAVGCKHEQE